MVIVASILLAFGIQAWWEESQERAEERDALERLDAEFLEVDSVLVEWRANHAAVVDACDVLLAHTGPAGSAAALSDDSLAFLIGEVRLGWTIDPPLATLSALESSGQIAALRNQDVLTQLASWRALMDDLQDDEEGLRESVDRHLNPYLYSHAALRTISNRAPVPWAAGEPSSFSSGLTDLLASRELENLVEDIRGRSSNILENYDAAQASLARVRTLISAELSN